MMTLGYSTLGANVNSMGLGANVRSLGLQGSCTSNCMGLGAFVHSLGLNGPLATMPLWQKVLLAGGLGYGGYYLYKRHQRALLKGRFFSRRRGLRGLGRGRARRRFHW